MQWLKVFIGQFSTHYSVTESLIYFNACGTFLGMGAYFKHCFTYSFFKKHQYIRDAIEIFIMCTKQLQKK